MSDPGDEAPKPLEIDPNDPGSKVVVGKLDLPVPVGLAEFESAIGRWINDHIRNSPVSEQVGAWNHLTAKLPLLRNYLNS